MLLANIYRHLVPLLIGHTSCESILHFAYIYTINTIYSLDGRNMHGYISTYFTYVHKLLCCNNILCCRHKSNTHMKQNKITKQCTYNTRAFSGAKALALLQVAQNVVLQHQWAV